MTAATKTSNHAMELTGTSVQTHVSYGQNHCIPFHGCPRSRQLILVSLGLLHRGYLQNLREEI